MSINPMERTGCRPSAILNRPPAGDGSYRCLGNYRCQAELLQVENGRTQCAPTGLATLRLGMRILPVRPA